jgi:RNA polymerase sigma factor (sigma-70 family)
LFPFANLSYSRYDSIFTMNNTENAQYLDQLLLQAMRQDDEKALAFLFTNYYNKLYRVGIKWCADSVLTEESIQLIFQDLWNYRHTLGDIDSFEAYLKASLKKRLSKELAKAQKYQNESLDEVQLSIASYEDILVAQEDNETQRNLVRQALDELSPRQKEIVVLKYFEELSYKEISDQTGLQVDSIYKILHEAIKRLKSILVAS